MIDSTEPLRREAVNIINSGVKSLEKDEERKRLEELYGQVWDTQELSKDFVVEGFMAPFITATRKKDNVKGNMMFQDRPRFYWGFK